MVKNKVDFECSYCHKKFKRERTLESHACEPRRRTRNKNEKQVIIAFDTFKKFYSYAQGSSGKRKTFQDFIGSAYYTAFIAFGLYCFDTRVISVERYAEYLIKREVPIKYWPMDKTYIKFLEYFIQIEPVADALTRSIEYGIKWGTENEEKSHDFFRKASVSRISQALSYGRISPWVLYQSDSGRDFLVGPHYANQSYWGMIDPDSWSTKFDKNKEDVKFAKSILTLGGW